MVVDNSTDNGSLSACTAAANDCSLRGAIAAAAVSGDRIQFDTNVFDSHPVIGLSGSELIVNKNIQIGTGFESSQIDISANGLSRVFNVPAGFSVGLVNLAIRDGFHPQTAGGIYSEGNLTILSCIIRNNIGGLAGFAMTGHPLWLLGLGMAAGQILGAALGARLAMRNGARLIKPLLVGTSTALAAKLLWDLV